MASKSVGHSARSDLTDRQRQLARTIDLATDTLLKYAAPEVPPLANYTPEGMLEELGRVNEGRKAMEKTEAILKERFKTLLEGRSELRSDNYNAKLENRPRTALDQQKAKDFFEAAGTLPEFMSTTEVPTLTVKPN